jgi:hypothetical protein
MKSIMLAVAILLYASGAYADGLQTYNVAEQTTENFPFPGQQEFAWSVSGPTIGGDDEVAFLLGIENIPHFDHLGLPIEEHTENGIEWHIGSIIFDTHFPVGYSLEAAVELPTGPTSVPELGTLPLVASALAGLGFLKRRLWPAR